MIHKRVGFTRMKGRGNCSPSFRIIIKSAAKRASMKQREAFKDTDQEK
jgi:hypothetical protein